MPTFTNQATLSYNNSVVSSNVVHGELVATLSITKTAVNETYTPGDIVTFAVSILNSGKGNFNSLTLTDDLGSYRFGGNTVTPLAYVADSVKLFVNGELRDAPDVDDDDRELVITDFCVPADGNALILYSAIVTEYAPMSCDGHIKNTVTLEGCGMCGDLTADARIYPAGNAQLSISKAVSPTTVVGCDAPVTFTFTVQNNGLAAALSCDDVCIRDSFGMPFDITSVTFNGMPWTDSAHYTYNSATGQFATVPGQITVPAANYEQDCSTGEWKALPGVSTLVITGTF